MRDNPGPWAMLVLALLGVVVYFGTYVVPTHIECDQTGGVVVLNMWQVPICINEGE